MRDQRLLSGLAAALMASSALAIHVTGAFAQTSILTAPAQQPQTVEDAIEEPPTESVSTENALRTTTDPDAEEDEGFRSERIERNLGNIEEEPTQLLEAEGAFLRGLDKITGRSEDAEILVDQSLLIFGLKVTLRACHQSSPIDTPESVAFLEVEDWGFHANSENALEAAPDDEKRIFSGWMYASTPGLSAIEHPVYDVWVIKCNIPEPEFIPIEEDSDESLSSE